LDPFRAVSRAPEQAEEGPKAIQTGSRAPVSSLRGDEQICSMAPLQQHAGSDVAPIKKQIGGNGGVEQLGSKQASIKMRPSIFPTYANSSATGSKRECCKDRFMLF
jgi:hypothetical protein